MAPFHSVLVRADPANPGSGRILCDLCTAIPTPTDDGKTYTFTIRQGVKFQDGSILTAADVAASWHEIIFPRKGVRSYVKGWKIGPSHLSTTIWQMSGWIGRRAGMDRQDAV
ncbi:MAG: hypothetical protein EXR07_05715 [Acetobacteraceae bacterium]|nr:hypothetical protein [Acetobacteraceae bacterium]